MSVFDTIQDANAAYARGFTQGGLTPPPRRKFAVLTCMDARLDPARALGLELGDAHILRNAGGRVTDDVIRSLVISQQMLGTDAVAVVHHTECGMLTFTDEQARDRLRPILGAAIDEIDFLSFTDQDQCVRDDLAALRANPLIPDSIAMRGYLYDVHTGALREVREGARMPEAGGRQVASLDGTGRAAACCAASGTGDCTMVAVDGRFAATGYAHPEVLVSTEWVADHANDPNVRIVESDEDILLYDLGHIPGAIRLDWHTDLQDPVERDFLDQAAFERLMRANGIANDTTVVFYGDRNNWYATYAFWLFKMYGHADCRVMDGGRSKWEAEDRPMTRDMPTWPEATYTASEPDHGVRAFRDDVMAMLQAGKPQLVDVRSPQEYTGEVLHMAGYPQEGAQRGGHVLGAQNIPWSLAANQDGTFKKVDDLRTLYRERDILPEKPTIAYCRIGERSSHTWFVLTYLLGYPNVRNYDGSWTEWGSLVRSPIAKGSEPYGEG
ncbi:MAG: hypothetical protein IT337_05100 [Thermomicrobiales bacterium]|nr:hypothetical protein [Thermomicrobiales bacterium]